MAGRRKSYVEIEGIFDTEVLGTFSIIRGFALLQDLAKISVPVFMQEAGGGQVTGYQRELDPKFTPVVPGRGLPRVPPTLPPSAQSVAFPCVAIKA